MIKNQTPRGSRLVITLFGRRNAGKSQLLNSLCEQEVAIVSASPGTTTDPVLKHYELIPLGPVSFYDTAGFDDEGDLGILRIQATNKVLDRSDLVLFVVTGEALKEDEKAQIEVLNRAKIPFILVYNKSDLMPLPLAVQNFCVENKVFSVEVSAKERDGIDQLKEAIFAHVPESFKNAPPLLGDIIAPNDFIICVVPIDLSAPKGRLILPQVQVLREILDYGGVGITVKDTELAATLASIGKTPALVVTDSQAIKEVAAIVPTEIPLTTFSSIYARCKGDFSVLLEGTRTIDTLEDGARILMGEACSHHVVSDDIGRVKLPAWLQKYTGKELNFDFASGYDFPKNLEDYDLVVHCGSCMLNRTEMLRRIHYCVRKDVPITNYGLAISKLQGVLDRVVAPLIGVLVC
ncbi:MAG: [FeFe] hydrogenase H-cluster maturation GTPase HydF [Desulfotalea sp.]